MDREQARRQIKAEWRTLIKDITQPARKKVNGETSYICPIPNCENGAGKDGDGLTFNPKSQDGNSLHCFKCGFKGDIISLYEKTMGVGYNEALTDLAGKLGISIDGTQPARKEKLAGSKPATAAPRKIYTDYYQKVRAARSEAPAQEYLRRRGISAEVASRYGLGYDANFKTKDSETDAYTVWQALIIPTSESGYNARNIDAAAGKNERYRSRGEKRVFNGTALDTAEKPIFVVEGEIDALSVIEAGGEAVGLGSADNIDKLRALLQERKPQMPLILALDPDETGQRKEEELAAWLTDQSIPFFRYNPYGAAKDANEALLLDREGFISEVAVAEGLAQKEKELAQKAEQEAKEAAKEEYLKTSAAAHTMDFFRGVSSEADTPAYSTGFNNLDSILDGGLYEGLYVIGAISSLGKTTLALQIADQLAQQGQDVLLFSLEMARSELMAKSISRLTYLDADNKAYAKTTRGITVGARYEKYSKPEWDLITGARDFYMEYAQHIFIHEGIGDIGVAQVKETVQKHISITGNKPVVIIDYLQILAPYDMRASDKQNTDKAVLELKRLSRDNKIPVIGISSFNRESYKTNGGINKGKVSMTDFKESGAIEYSADVLLGLEFAGAGDKDYNEAEEKRKHPREIRLIVLKNRNGKAWEEASFKYYQLFNYFEEERLDKEWLPAAQDPFSELRKARAK